MTVIQETDTNEICNSNCKATANCKNMWSLVQYDSYLGLTVSKSIEKVKVLVHGGHEKRTFLYGGRSDQLRVKKIASQYAKMYLEKNDYSNSKYKGRFYWMALGAIAAKQVYCGILALDDFVSKYAGGVLLEGANKILDKQNISDMRFIGTGGISKDDFDYMRKCMLKGNLWLYLDIYPYHEYYSRFPNTFSSCLNERNGNTYDSKVAKDMDNMPYNEGYKSLNKFKYDDAVLNNVKKAFKLVSKFEKEKDITKKQKIQLENLMTIAIHEQNTVLEKSFYSPKGNPDPRLKSIFDKQLKLEKNHQFYTQFGALFADVQARQAVFTNACTLPIALNVLPDKDKFFENMLEDENLYIVKQRMKFITRIANDFHYVMKKYPKYMESCLIALANGDITEKIPVI
jgi:hypothetical protein